MRSSFIGMFYWLGAAAVLAWTSSFALGDDVILQGTKWDVSITPQTLRAIGTPANGAPITISTANVKPDIVVDLRHTDRRAQWTLAGAKLAVVAQLDGDALVIQFTAADAGEFTWPILAADPACRAYVLPLFEGVYVPADDQPWAEFLHRQGPLNTTAEFSMPFWGLDLGGRTLTYIATNQFNNEIVFNEDQGKLASRFTHEFTPNRKVKQFGFRIQLGNASVVEPAKVYRQYLMDRGEFVTMKQKIQRTPNAAKLPGAAHVYLWGEGNISRYDFTNLKRLAGKIIEQSNAPAPSPGRRIFGLMGAESRKTLAELATKEWIDNYDKGLIAEELSRLLASREFYDAASWQGIALEPAVSETLKHGIASLAPGELFDLNRRLLHGAFTDCLKPVETWGDGLSPKMIQMFADAGLDRLWLGSPDWQGLTNWPQTIKKAQDLGYLIGPYDSFNGIHSPDEKETWETSQFDRKLYEDGPVIGRDGKKKSGFKHKGYLLSPAAARPYVERRVSGLMETFRCNSWFIDCDAFGDLLDDYSPIHPATQEDDMNARLSRMAWIRDHFGVVIGSEGGSAYAAGTIHFAHGIMTPGIGWGDPDLTTKTSPYYMGSYYPPDGPAVFIKQVSMKPIYRRIYADPRFRLPLYEMVFHDSVVATHQWGFGSLKFTDEDHARELLELLYSVPPLYHLNVAEWEHRKEEITAHYAFFSPLHRETALLAMTEFRWLSADHLIQRTVFGDQIELIANFSGEAFQYEGAAIPKQAILAKWRRIGKTLVYVPEPKSEKGATP